MYDILRRALLLLLLAGLPLGLPLSTSAQGPGKDEKGKANEKEIPRDNKVNINLDHIFTGGINRNGDLVGIHHYPSAPKEMEVNGKKCKVEFYFQNKGGPTEVTTARVQVRDLESKKIVGEKFSTLYPSGWTKAQIEQAIREAYQDAKDSRDIDNNGKWGGKCGAGFRIEGYLSSNNRTITTAFPIYKKK